MFNILFNEDAIAQSVNSYILLDCEGHALSDTFTGLKSSFQFLNYVKFYLGIVIFQVELWLLIRVNQRKDHFPLGGIFCEE